MRIFHSSMLKCSVQVMRWRDTRAHRPAICTRNRCTHYVQFNEQPLLAEASTILDRSLTHLRTFSDNGVYVALQLFLVILVSDQWHRVLIPYSYRQAPWGLLHAQGWLSRYTWDQQLYVVSEPRETHSPMLKERFLHLTNLVAQPGIETPTSWLPGQRVTTRPRFSVTLDTNMKPSFSVWPFTIYHSYSYYYRV